ncbi:MAG: hypothetical protein WAU88_15405 [Candidatus Zixiibacteriota bacterium]
MKNQRLIRTAASLVLLTGLFGFVQAQAVELNGSIFTNLYSFRQSDFSRTQSYSGARVTLIAWRDRFNRTLELRTNFRYAADLQDNSGIGPRFFVYETYLRLTNAPARSEFSLGRQFVYNSIQSNLMDGLQARYPINRVWAVSGFGGVSALSSDPEHIQNFSYSGLIGATLAAQLQPTLHASANLLFRKVDGRTSETRAGLDIGKEVGIWSLFGKGIFNAPHTRISELLGRVSVRPKDWYFAAEAFYREPSVSDNSLWSIIDFDYYRQVRVEARRIVCKSMSVGGQLAYTAGSPDGTVQTRLSIASAWYSLGWSHQNGYGGDNDGFFGTLSARVTPHIDIYAGTNLSTYKIDALTTERSDSYGSTAGVFWHGSAGFSVRAEGQWFRNRVITSGTRFYLRASKDFSIGKPARKVRA